MIKEWVSRIQARFLAYAALVGWGALVALLLLNRGSFDASEDSARVMLFLWSIADQIANPIVTLGVPDFRALFLIPAAFVFPGSLLAGKLTTLVLVAVTSVATYRWQLRGQDAEAPMLATGLLLLSPLLIQQIDAIAVGPYLWLIFVAGAWADAKYRAAPLPFGGLYFTQLLLCIAALSLHPAGLAYPAALVWVWLRTPPPAPDSSFVPGSLRVQFLAGIAVATVGGLLLAAGWPQLAWFGDPIAALSSAVLGLPSGERAGEVRWIVGGLVAAGVAIVAWRRLARSGGDLLALCTLLGLLLGLLASDGVLSLLALVTLLYWGFPALLALRVRWLPAFIGQRGIAFVLLIALATVFMSLDRGRYARLQDTTALSAQDRLISALADAVAGEQGPPPAVTAPAAKSGAAPRLRVASQWPGRTMVACACNTLPLPPAGGDEQALLKMLHGVQFLVFDPRLPANAALAHNLAMLGGRTAETLALQPGGVIVRLRDADGAPAPSAPAAPG